MEATRRFRTQEAAMTVPTDTKQDASAPGKVKPAPKTPSRKRTFHRGDVVNFNPARADHQSQSFLQDFVLKGWLPEAPFVKRGTKITAFGSCFAANITRHLSAIGYDLSSNRDPDIYISRMGDGMVNTASILGQFEWALENKKQRADLWHGQKAERYGYDEDIRLRTRDVFLATEFFIITLGLSEIWYDEMTGGTFWRAVPEQSFVPGRHNFRVLSVEETRADIAAIYNLIVKHVPDAKVLFTVSPIALSATFRPVSCMTANSVSKAIIRAALDEFLRSQPDALNKSLFYFPSMEIAQFVFVDPWEDDGRHPRSYVLDTIMKAFEATYCVGEASLDDANRMLRMFRAKNVRDVVKRRADFPDFQELVTAANATMQQGRRDRGDAKQHEANLKRDAGAATSKDAEDGDDDLDS
jgi:hypothetical protein